MKTSKLRALTALSLFAACSSSSKKAATPADTKGAPQAFAFQIGGREAFALEDGDLVVPNDGKVIATVHVDEAGALLAKAGLPGDTISSRCW